jgi:hypothetical protein
MRGSCALLLLFVGAALPQDDRVSPDLLLLARIKVHMSERLARQPNYTCLQTIERSIRRRGSRKYELRDMVRLEVGLVEGKELFSWPGGKRFEETELRNLVPTGAIGNGNFALHARSVFHSTAPVFTWRGEEELNGRRAVRYDFRVSQMLSGYTIKVSEQQAVVGYHGSFWADPVTLDAMRLEVIADDIPPALALEEATQRMDYALMQIGSSRTLLPDSSEMIMVDLSGTENRNFARFTDCRQYSGESILSFDDPAPEVKPAEPIKIVEITLPAGLALNTALLDEIAVESAAIGDPVRARVDGPVKSKGQVLVPKGALVLGRVSRIEKHANFVVIGIRFSSIEFPGAQAAFRATMGSIALPPAVASPPLGLKPDTAEAIIGLRGSRGQVPRGTLIFWRTEL